MDSLSLAFRPNSGKAACRVSGWQDNLDWPPEVLSFFLGTEERKIGELVPPIRY
jgi:hypothetical protein